MVATVSFSLLSTLLYFLSSSFYGNAVHHGPHVSQATFGYSTWEAIFVVAYRFCEP